MRKKSVVKFSLNEDLLLILSAKTRGDLDDEYQIEQVDLTFVRNLSQTLKMKAVPSSKNTMEGGFEVESEE